ncbi:hypothetical protein N7453_001022 [Penicillium expansum]|nr:hypothetical protein N7453_001022 [Penicillium expansum]
MLLEILHRLGSEADCVLMYPSKWSIFEDRDSYESHMLRYTRDHYAAKLKPIEILIRPGSDAVFAMFVLVGWSKSCAKLLAFHSSRRPAPSPCPRPTGQIRERVFSLLHSFSLSRLQLPSIARLTQFSVNSSIFDMEIMQKMYRGTALTIP